MAIVFYYTEKKNMDHIVSSGLKISESVGTQVKVDGDMKPCIIGFLSPKDDVSKYGEPDYICLELDVDVKDMYVLNGDLDTIDKRAYAGSVIPLENYKFGTYRRPEVAVTSDIPSDKISVSGKIIGTPILFESSDKIYKNGVMEKLRLKYSDFDETLLGIFFMMMVSKGRMNLLGQKKYGSKTVYVYEDNSSGEVYTLGVQEGNG